MKPLNWGRVTQKGNKLYLHVFDKTATSVELSGLKGHVLRAYRLADKAPMKLDVTGFPVVDLGKREGSPSDVYVVEVEGALSVERVLQKQEASGRLKLESAEADVHGGLQYEANLKALGFWTSKNGGVKWDFVLNQPGEFKVSLEYACEPGSEGATFEVGSDGSRVQGEIKATKGWSDFVTLDLGTVSLVHPGKTTLEVKALTKPKMAVMNLRRIILTPVK